MHLAGSSPAASIQADEYDSDAPILDASRDDAHGGSSTPRTPPLLLPTACCPLATGAPTASATAAILSSGGSACSGWEGSNCSRYSRYSCSSSGWDGNSHNNDVGVSSCVAAGAAAVATAAATTTVTAASGSAASLASPINSGSSSGSSGCSGGGRRLCLLERLMLEDEQQREAAEAAEAAFEQQAAAFQQQQQQQVEQEERGGNMEVLQAGEEEVEEEVEAAEEDAAAGEPAPAAVMPPPDDPSDIPLLQLLHFRRRLSLRRPGLPAAAPPPLPLLLPLGFDTLQGAEWVARLGPSDLNADPRAGDSSFGGCNIGACSIGAGGEAVPCCVVDLVRLHLPATAAATATATAAAGEVVQELLAARKSLLGRDVGSEALFEEEAMALQAVRGCPYVVPYLGSAVCADRLQLFTQWAPASVASELEAALARCPQDPASPRLLLPAQRLRVIGACALRALCALHAAEPPIAHLDVRPANLLLLQPPEGAAAAGSSAGSGGGGGCRTAAAAAAGGRVVLGGFGSAVRLLDSYELDEDGALDLDMDLEDDSGRSVDSFDLLGRPAARYVDVGVPGTSYSRVGAGVATAGGAAGSPRACCSCCCACCGCWCGCGGCGGHGGCGGGARHGCGGCPRLPEAPCYLAPELLPWGPHATAAAAAAATAGQVLVTAKADVYAVGVLLAVCAVWHGCPGAVVARWQRGGAALPACVPRPLRHLIGMCTATDPVLRPSAEEALRHPFFAGLAMEELLL
ncbi:hypothetical protein HYH02_014207 [Chlamydomonas schloesseri]|uniref:non-specific serine/threonine protein kinase n=1 Tax=Chlamydomonas schloesseri TaxID=2026947 RepID=A0A835SV94_9CHLO|nr:hypothetical protein HYH02_014207 [Chlamydomonas schloesseri]|eukprot:KAG2428884.1 hypothetical protein HYH02_014207 [Chlamydomonas schloesseri]